MRQQEMENKEPMDQSPEETVETPAPRRSRAQNPPLRRKPPSLRARQRSSRKPCGRRRTSTSACWQSTTTTASAAEGKNAWAPPRRRPSRNFPVYDNLGACLKQETRDEAYAKGVQMTMTQLKTVLEKLGVEEIPAQGQPFDPNLHNAVMHMEDEAFGENIVAEVFQAGFKLGEKVIRHALVKVAN